jgi:hypothetical protein
MPVSPVFVFQQREIEFLFQVYKGLNIESGEVVAVKQVQLNVINAEQLDSMYPSHNRSVGRLTTYNVRR